MNRVGGDRRIFLFQGVQQRGRGRIEKEGVASPRKANIYRSMGSLAIPGGHVTQTLFLSDLISLAVNPVLWQYIPNMQITRGSQNSSASLIPSPWAQYLTAKYSNGGLQLPVNNVSS